MKRQAAVRVSHGLGTYFRHRRRAIDYIEIPQGQKVKFHAAAGGAGAGLALPCGFENQRLHLPRFSASGSWRPWTAGARFYVLDGFKGDELAAEDLEGWFYTNDASANVIVAGFSGTAMLLGLAPTSIPLEVVKDGLLPKIVNKMWPSVLAAKQKRSC